MPPYIDDETEAKIGFARTESRKVIKEEVHNSKGAENLSSMQQQGLKSLKRGIKDKKQHFDCICLFFSRFFFG